MNRFNGSLEAFNKRYKMNLKPIGTTPPVVDPDPEIEAIMISGLEDSSLNLRASIWGPVIGFANNDAVFDVKDSKRDTSGRLWYQVYGVGRLWEVNPWLASWYTIPA